MKLFTRIIAPRRQRTTTLNLLICGAQRSGTTSLKYYLEEHPEIGFLGQNDLTIEGRYIGYPFSSPIVAHSRLGDDPALYERISRRLAGTKSYIATKQPYFMVHAHVPLNLREQLPGAKLIFVLRNPTDAAFSAYCNGLGKGRRDGSFEEMVNLALEQTAELASDTERGRWYDYYRSHDEVPFSVDRGFYCTQLRRFHACLSPEQMLVLRFDEFTRDTRRCMRRVLEFLELDPEFEFTRLDEVKNASPKTGPPFEPRTREKLDAIYAESNRKVCEMLGWPRDLWSRR